ncbi:cupin domain-containing protein [Streptomyces telluris]|uniref:cupin domain-containing protein n=1 Tax=Streptomyces telluris TaxID=2720021 RepID=UPI003555D86A
MPPGIGVLYLLNIPPGREAVPGPVQVNFREVSIPPGGSTGKHCHHGQLVGVVKFGTLTHYAPVYPGGVHVYRTGDSITEGRGYVHEGRNEGSTPLVLWATLAGRLRRDAHDRGTAPGRR